MSLASFTYAVSVVRRRPSCVVVGFFSNQHCSQLILFAFTGNVPIVICVVPFTGTMSTCFSIAVLVANCPIMEASESTRVCLLEDYSWPRIICTADYGLPIPRLLTADGRLATTTQDGCACNQ